MKLLIEMTVLLSFCSIAQAETSLFNSRGFDTHPKRVQLTLELQEKRIFLFEGTTPYCVNVESEPRLSCYTGEPIQRRILADYLRQNPNLSATTNTLYGSRLSQSEIREIFNSRGYDTHPKRVKYTLELQEKGIFLFEGTTPYCVNVESEPRLSCYIGEPIQRRILAEYMISN